MRYDNVYIDNIAYELPEEEISTSFLEERISPILEKLKIPKGQLEQLTGIVKRRWWPENFSVSHGASMAARRALAKSQFTVNDIDALIYTGVCREHYEPATACHVAAALGVNNAAYVYDISNACLGVLNGIIEISNRIELGEIKTGMVVSCESARDINEIAIEHMRQHPEMEVFTKSLATLTGGSGAIAVIVTDKEHKNENSHKILGGVSQSSPRHHNLCRWGVEKTSNGIYQQFMSTDGVNVLKFGLELGVSTWHSFLDTMRWTANDVNKIITHQVGKAHRSSFMQTLKLDETKDFSSFPNLGNIGTVSLPITLQLANEAGFIKKGDKVSLLGIGSGLNCMMLGVEW